MIAGMVVYDSSQSLIGQPTGQDSHDYRLLICDVMWLDINRR